MKYLFKLDVKVYIHFIYKGIFKGKGNNIFNVFQYTFICWDWESFVLRFIILN